MFHRNTHTGNVILISSQKCVYAYLFVWTRGIYFQKFNLRQELDEDKDKTQVFFELKTFEDPYLDSLFCYIYVFFIFRNLSYFGVIHAINLSWGMIKDETQQSQLHFNS